MRRGKAEGGDTAENFRIFLLPESTAAASTAFLAPPFVAALLEAADTILAPAPAPDRTAADAGPATDAQGLVLP